MKRGDAPSELAPAPSAVRRITSAHHSSAPLAYAGRSTCSAFNANSLANARQLLCNNRSSSVAGHTRLELALDRARLEYAEVRLEHLCVLHIDRLARANEREERIKGDELDGHSGCRGMLSRKMDWDEDKRHA
jgi:hypothetical protein